MIFEHTMSEPTHAGVDDRPSGGRCVDVLSRPAVRMQGDDRYRLAGGCGKPIQWKPTILSLASLQVSRDMACQEFHSNRIEGCLAPDDTGANRGVPPRCAMRKVSKSNFFMILHPAVGNLRKQSIDLHPSVGSFKRGRSDIGGARNVENVMAGPSPGNNTAGAMLNRKP